MGLDVAMNQCRNLPGKRESQAESTVLPEPRQQMSRQLGRWPMERGGWEGRVHAIGILGDSSFKEAALGGFHCLVLQRIGV